MSLSSNVKQSLTPSHVRDCRNFFYKNVMGVGVLFWFQFYCGWSTT